MWSWSGSCFAKVSASCHLPSFFRRYTFRIRISASSGCMRRAIRRQSSASIVCWVCSKWSRISKMSGTSIQKGIEASDKFFWYSRTKVCISSGERFMVAKVVESEHWENVVPMRRFFLSWGTTLYLCLSSLSETVLLKTRRSGVDSGSML